MNREFDSLIETLAGLAAANIVILETLHEHGVIDKTHFAHAFARALDTLAPEHRGGMIERVLRNMLERCIEAGANDYIAKPVNVDVLLATLWRALQATHA